MVTHGDWQAASLVDAVHLPRPGAGGAGVRVLGSPAAPRCHTAAQREAELQPRTTAGAGNHRPRPAGLPDSDTALLRHAVCLPADDTVCQIPVTQRC